MQVVSRFFAGCAWQVVQPIFNLMSEQIGLMGAAGEQPALRLGYDDMNESACIASVLHNLSMMLEQAERSGADAWDRLLLLFNNKQAADAQLSLEQSGHRYPRSYRRLGKMTSMLKAALAPAAVRFSSSRAAGNVSRPVGTAADNTPSSWATGSVNGSAPLVHLLPSLRVTDRLWAQLFKKTFVETRCMGAVMVAFSRLLILHAVFLCLLTLWAYKVPTWSLAGTNTDPSMFTAAFWSANGLVIAECASWGVFVHAVLHVFKDLIIMQLLAAPKAVRLKEYFGDQRPVTLGSTDAGKLNFHQRLETSLKQWWQRQWWRSQLKEGEMVVVQPGVHSGRVLKGHNVITLVFWLACCVFLLDSHIPSWPLHKALSGTNLLSGAGPSDADGLMPVWAFAALIYLGLWILHEAWRTITDLLPGSLGIRLSSLARKDGRRVAEHFFPYGNMSSSQDWHRYIINCLLWLLVFIIKFLFDFFVVLLPLSKGPAHKLLGRLGPNTLWVVWAESILLVFALWVTAAFLVFYDTGLFWQLIGALYSTLVLGMHRRIGHVKTWYDLVWAFPRLGYKLSKKMLPAANIPGTPAAGPTEAEAVETAAAAAIQPTVDASPAHTADALADVVCPFRKMPLCPPSEVLFAQAWDQAVSDLRQRDLLSNAEAKRLKYELLSPSPDPTCGGWLLLPRFVAAGAAVEVATLGVNSASQLEVVCRAFNLLAWLLHSLGLITELQLSDLLLLASKGASPPPRNRAAARGNDAGSTAATGGRVASHSDIAAASEVLKDCKELLVKLKAMLTSDKPVDLSNVDTQLLLEAAIKGVALLGKGHAKHLAPDISKAAVPPGWNQAPSQQRKLPKQVVEWLVDMLTLTRGEVAPVVPEASRVLCFFATSLNNPKMPPAATVACSRSMATLTPHYGEDVMYALNAGSAVQEMGVEGLKGRDGSVFLTNGSGDATETLKYLREVYKIEWINFVERLITNADIVQQLNASGQTLPAQLTDITPASFFPGAVLAPWLHELLSWASMRGQLLLRTVHGMMYYEQALQQLILMQCKVELAAAAQQAAKRAGVPLRDQREWVAAVSQQAALMMARQKYTYVVSRWAEVLVTVCFHVHSTCMQLP
eukprot:GHRR01011145.1.p1 GENE.GHRR01011145.1~~GHRR01011145.1.p1  ORF type:complete len:1109 (+),score=334.63 GHRR01011145.1:1762-5088(+)